MNLSKIYQKSPGWLIFCGIVIVSTVSVGMMNQIAVAAPATQDSATAAYVGSSACLACHEDMFSEWASTRHANAYSSPIFQKDWIKMGQDASCLECHTTGYNPSNGSYAEEGVSCEACHGPYQPTHPNEPEPFTPSAEICSKCHKDTVNEWLASAHSQNDVQCQACHNPHAQIPKAESVTALCSSCHEARGDTFAHGTHATSGLECSNCHMYTKPRMEDPVMGHVPTGHTFLVGSEACIGCHQDTVHTRDSIIQLTDEVAQESLDIASLQQKIAEQEQEITYNTQAITELEAMRPKVYYSGLIQGAVIGLVTGGITGWFVNRSLSTRKHDEDK